MRMEKGLSIWDALSDGHVKHNDNGNIACDQYHLYKEDIALMKRMKFAGISIFQSVGQELCQRKES